ncbi:hypothetical protein A9Q86_03950 [Flavobacteriales bacterium 33_180_T64]|nr:hypothetical protein A9Q86_03950 [Flavobacteriales bacterium 33_180_T64]
MDIFLPKVKEPNYFSEVDSPKSEDFEQPKLDETYHSKIINSKEIYDSLYQNANDNQLKGDTSPSYLWDKNTAKKLFNHNPKAKIIISLRHPIDRAYSHYIMNYYTGVDKSKTFIEALNSKKNEMWGSCNQYKEMSRYFEQVKEYYTVFPKDQIKIIVYEDWTKNIQNEIIEIFKFLNLNTNDEIEINQVNSNKIKPLKKVALLNILRQNKIKSMIKKVLNQDRVDTLKSFFFNDDKEIEKLDSISRDELSQEFKKEIKMLSDLTQIDFITKWN